MHDPLSVRIIGTATDVRGVVQLAEVPGDGGRLVATKLFAPLAVIELRGADASDPLRVTHASTPRDDAEGPDTSFDPCNGNDCLKTFPRSD